jgi:hypothetical protein
MTTQDMIRAITYRITLEKVFDFENKYVMWQRMPEEVGIESPHRFLDPRLLEFRWGLKRAIYNELPFRQGRRLSFLERLFNSNRTLIAPPS